MMNKKLAVFFPGIGYTVDKPLLYYSRKLAASAGYDIRLLPYTGAKPPSIFLITENRLKNILLFKSNKDKVISIDYLYSEKGEEAKVSGMLKKTISLLERQYPADTRIEMLLCGDQLEKMYRNLFGMPEDYMLVVSGKVIGSRLWDIDY